MGGRKCCVTGYANGELEQLEKLSKTLSALIDTLGSKIVYIYIDSQYGKSIYRMTITRERARKYAKIYTTSYSRGLGWKTEEEKKPLEEWEKLLEEIKNLSFDEGEIVRWKICFKNEN